MGNFTFDYSEWYASCDFIDNNMKFYSFKEFLKDRRVIKRLFKSMDYRTKKLYQWYINAGQYSYKVKCIIWDYLNDYKTDDDLAKYIEQEFRTKK